MRAPPHVPARRRGSPRPLRVLAILAGLCGHTARRTPRMAPTRLSFHSAFLRTVIVLATSGAGLAEARNLDFAVAAPSQRPSARVLTFCIPDGEEAVRAEALDGPQGVELI